MSGRRASKLQYAALPYRKRGNGAVEILLVTSRGTGRWIIPKGWPMQRLAPHEAAAKEAVEEGGVIGRIGAQPIGNFRYAKQRDGTTALNCDVTVFALEVVRQLSNWPEQHQRRTRWFALREAAKAVQEPELAEMIRNLAALLGETA
jgi:8-oxo-dGTP pyrophosphatase MutT (NUDIX family)